MNLPGVVVEVARRYALGSDPVVESGPFAGELGRVWGVRTSSGRWAVKELNDPARETDVREAADFQDAAVRAGVPAPEVVRTPGGDVLVELGGRPFRVFSWLDLAPADIGLDPAEVGSVVAAIHRLSYAASGAPRPWYTEPVGEQEWDALLQEVAAGGYPRADELLAQRDELCGLESLIEPPTRVQRLHLDLWADNVRRTAAGGLGVIDWDNSGAGDPRQELAAVLFEYCSGSPGRARELVASYATAGGAARITRAEDFSMAIAQLGHILEWQCRQFLAAETPERREHARAAIGEFVDRPLTRAVVDELVDALT